MDSIIRIENLTYRYPETTNDALRGVTLNIERGSFTAVLGPNGSGKSTLAKHFNAILVPTSGRVLVKDMDTANESLFLPIRRTVGMVFQNPDNQIVASVVEDDVAFAPENLGVPSAEIRKRVDDVLHCVGMYEYRLQAPYRLSGGQKQRVAIAGVLAMQPEVLVLDEPTAMLDPAGRREVVRTVNALRRETGMTVVLITHHMEECVGADRLLVMQDGMIEMDGTPEEIFSQAGRLREMGLDVPVPSDILLRLRQAGLEVPEGALDTESCAQAIAATLHIKKN